jgi:hypothetical protein
MLSGEGNSRGDIFDFKDEKAQSMNGEIDLF